MNKSTNPYRFAMYKGSTQQPVDLNLYPAKVEILPKITVQETLPIPNADTKASFPVTLTNVADADVTVYKDEACTEEETEWITAAFNADQTAIEYVAKKNTGKVRTAYIQIYALSSDGNEATAIVTVNQAAAGPGGGEGGGENPGVTTVSLDETEIKDLGKLAYTDEKTINDGEVTWTVHAYKEAATRPYLQLKKDSGVYVKISAPSAIKEVRLTITSATNSKGGAEDISKHSAYSSSGTISLKSADAAGDAIQNDVVSCTGNAISNNKVTLVPDGAYTDLYLKVSAGARIWGIEVDY